MKPSRIFILGCATLMAGCASVSLEESFQPVQSDSAELHGEPLEWVGVTTSEEEVAQFIDEALSDGLTATEAVRIALLNNARLQAIYEDFGVAQADLVEAARPENPEFSAELVFADAGNAWELELAESFLSVLTIPMRKRLAEDKLERTRLAILSASIDIAMDTRRAYLHYLADKRNFRLLTDFLRAEGAAADLSRRLHEAGNIPQSELTLAEQRHEQAMMNYTAAELDLEASRERINRLMGLWGLHADWESADALPENLGGFELLENPEREAVANSLDLAEGWLAVQSAADEGTLNALREVLPAHEAGVKFESEAPAGDDREWDVGPILTVSLPVFNQGQPARIKRDSAVRRAWQLYTATAVELRSATRTAAHRIIVAREAASYAKEIMIPNAEQSVEETLLRYNAMLTGPVELLESRQRAIEVEMGYVTALLEYWLARADFDQILMGRLVIRAPGDRPDIIGANVQQGSDESGGDH